MKCQCLFAGENKKKCVSKYPLLKLLPRMLSVKVSVLVELKVLLHAPMHKILSAWVLS